MADFKVSRGTTVISSGNASATITEGTDYDLDTGLPSGSGDAFVRIVNACRTGGGKTSGGGAHNVDDFTVHISNPGNLSTSVDFTRKGTSGDCRVDWEVIQYIGDDGGENQIRVRQVGTLKYLASDTSKDATESSISDDTMVVPFVTGQAAEDTGRSKWGDGMFYAEHKATPAKTYSFTRLLSNGRATVSYALVEFVGAAWNIQWLQFDVADTAPTSPSAKNWTVAFPNQYGRKAFTSSVIAQQTMLHNQYATDNDPAGSNDVNDCVVINGPNYVRTYQRLLAGTRRHHVWVIEHDPATAGGEMKVEHVEDYRSNTSGPEEKTFDISVTQTAPDDQVSVMGPSSSSDGGSTGHPRCAINLRHVSSGTVRATEADTSQERWLCFDFVQWPCEPRAISASISASASVAAAVEADGALATAIDGQASESPALFGRGEIDASATGSAATSASPAARGSASATLAGSATVAGILCGRADVTAALAGAGSVSAALQSLGRIAATINGTATVSPLLLGLGELAATAAGSAAVSGLLCGVHSAFASVSGSAVVSGPLCGLAGIQASVDGATSIAADLTVPAIGLQATLAGSATVAPNIVGRGALAAAVDGTASAAAQIRGLAALEAEIAGSATVTAQIEALGALAGTLLGSAAVSALLCGRHAAEASIAAAASVLGAIQVPGDLAASISGSASVAGVLEGVGALQSTVEGQAALAALLEGVGVLACEISGQATEQPEICGRGAVQSAISGSASAAPDVTGVGPLLAQLAGDATVSGTLCGRGALTATIVGAASVLVSTLEGCYFAAAALARRTWGSDFEIGESVASLYDDQDSTLVAIDGAPIWARVHVTFDDDALAAAFGEVGLVRKRARMVASLHVPLGEGDAAAMAMADKIVSALRQRRVGMLRFSAPYLTPGKREGKWWRLDVVCPFDLTPDAPRT